MEKKKMNDKGFSLVELIIVIAIMAILVAVLAPQYLKFVERSRKSADRDTVDQIIRAIQIDAADPESEYDNHTGTVTLQLKGAASASAATNSLGDILEDTGITIENVVIKSKEWYQGVASGNPITKATTIVITFEMDGDNVKATVTANGVAGAKVVDSKNSNAIGE